ncbi:hypothetical protein [Nitratireductor sp. StC3]|uniref:hypothetical protein n=1 Tax=Nitratireductor sp. StC3 TaxID=2126741 RepID=UPI000D0CD3D8|nr:hypothetical protein [Nitratireductor sp. StC3]PSM18220.1 hypothetical protein C7T96_10135 [Nitratireductor sp. StC3]
MAKTNKGSTHWVCSTAQPSDLDQSGYEGLAWVQVKQVGSFGESGRNTNIVSYDTLETVVSLKDKGITNAGDPPMEVARAHDDPGQIILRTFGGPGSDDICALKEIKRDGTVVYRRGVVAGPVRPGGRNEDFDLEVFTIGLLQDEIVVNPV